VTEDTPSGALRRSVDSFRIFGKDLETGLYNSIAGLDNTTANLFLVMDGAAGIFANATGSKKGGALAPLEEYYRQEARVWGEKAFRTQGGRTSFASKATQMLGQLPISLATAGAAIATSGAVAGLAGLGALEVAEEGLTRAALGAITGGTIGRAFKVAQPVRSGLGRGGFVGSTAATLETATGATPEEATLGGLTVGVLSGVAGGTPKPISELVHKSRVEAARTRLAESKPPKAEPTREGPRVEIELLSPERVAGAEKALDTPGAIPVRPDRVVRPNLDRIKGTADYKKTEAELVDFFRTEIDQARRGVITHAQTEAAARDLNMTMEQFLTHWKGQTLNAEELTAKRVMFQSVYSTWYENAKLIKAGGADDVAKANFAKQTMLFEAAAESVLGASAEVARATSAMRIAAGPSLKEIKQIRSFIKDFKGRTQGRELEEFADMVAALETPGQAAQFVRQARKATKGQMVMEAWINALLSGPPTHVVNGVSNQLVALWTIPTTYTAAGVGALRSGAAGVLGRPTPERVFFSEGNARLYGLVQGAGDGLRLAGQVLRTGEPSDVFSKVELPRQRSITGESLGLERFGSKAVRAGDLAGELTRTPGRFLMAGDEYFKAIGYRQEVNARAVRTAKMEGLHGAAFRRRVAEIVNNPSEELRAVGLQNARVQTFTNELGKMAKQFSDFSNTHPVVKINFPFVRTPTNIFKFSIQQSPASFMLGETRAALRKGGAARDTEMGKIVFGTAVGMWAANEAASGNITGGGPINPDERRLWYQLKRPYSVRVPKRVADWIEGNIGLKFDDRAEATGDAWVGYGRLEPLGTILGVSADWAEIAGHAEEEEAEEITARIVMSFRRNVENKTFLQGVTSAAAALNDPVYEGGEWLQRLAGTVVPTGVAQWTRATDPTLREVDSMMDKIKSRLPTYSETLPSKLNVWGEPITLDGGFGSDFISPFYSSRVVPDKASSEAYRLRAVLRPPDKHYRKMELTREEVHLIRQLTGRVAKLAIDEFVETPEYGSLPDIMRKEKLEEMYTKARTHVETELFISILVEQPGRFTGPALEIIEELKKQPTEAP
jgi:hypothetical protein